MPGILHNIRSNFIRQIIIQHPVQHTLVIAARALQNLISRNSELRTARGTDLLRDIGIAEQFLPCFSIMLLTRVTRFSGFPERLHLRWTAGIQLAAQTDEALLLDKVALQGSNRVHVAVVHGIGVPGAGPAVAVWMEEDDDGGEVIVMIDEKLQVGLGFATLVGTSVDGGVNVVNCVDEIAPSVIG